VDEHQSLVFILKVYPQMVRFYHTSISALAKQHSLLLIIIALSVEDGVDMHCGVRGTPGAIFEFRNAMFRSRGGYGQPCNLIRPAR
jgi:hypothetical protein